MEALVMVADAALRAGVTMASHDDDCAEKVAMMREIGVAISEFPVELEAARAASGHGMHVVVGAPNVLLGGSNSGNMSAVDAIREKMAAVLCSDYYAPALLPAVFHLHRAEGIPMAEAVRMASENPARAVGMEDRIGSLRPGLAADFILVEENGRNPVVREAWVAGKRVFTKAAGSPFTDEVYDVAAGETIHAS
jgi:alpha-D-ribose 1-methylphosphonate 5-triphosphate diphosphatase